MLGQILKENRFFKMSSKSLILMDNKKNIKKSFFLNYKINACICINVIEYLVYRDISFIILFFQKFLVINF